MRAGGGVLAVCAVVVHAIACGGGGSGADAALTYPTFEACWTDTTTVLRYTTEGAIGVCCIDRVIGGAISDTLCGESVQACETYVTANLDPADATADEIATACNSYYIDRM